MPPRGRPRRRGGAGPTGNPQNSMGGGRGPPPPPRAFPFSPGGEAAFWADFIGKLEENHGKEYLDQLRSA